MVLFFSKLLSTERIRLTIVIIFVIISMLMRAKRLITKERKDKFGNGMIYWFTILVNVIIYVVEIVISYIWSKEYWYKTEFIDFIKSPYDIYIMCLFFVLAYFTTYVICEMVLECIIEIKSWYTSSKLELFYKLFQIVCTIFITKLELKKLAYLYNNAMDTYDYVYVLFATVIFWCANHFIVFVFEKLKATRNYEKELLLMRVQNELQLEKYMALNDRYEASGKMIHDINKHLNMLDALMDKDNIKAREYKEEIKRQVNSLATGFSCSNGILNVIMNQKILEAENKNITVNINMVDVNIDYIKDVDITAIFANMWDNAIEAASKKGVDNPYINIVIGKIMDFIIISFENSFDGNVLIKDDKLISAKGIRHGFGLKILDEAVKKYKGQFTVEVKENIFKSKVVLPISR